MWEYPHIYVDPTYTGAIPHTREYQPNGVLINRGMSPYGGGIMNVGLRLPWLTESHTLVPNAIRELHKMSECFDQKSNDVVELTGAAINVWIA
jgi:hypothetical protein